MTPLILVALAAGRRAFEFFSKKLANASLMVNRIDSGRTLSQRRTGLTVWFLCVCVTNKTEQMPNPELSTSNPSAASFSYIGGKP